jgi:glutathione peroxidase
MKSVVVLLVTFFSFSVLAENVYMNKLTTLKGESYDLAKHMGKVTLFVNIATKCGYTPQLSALEELHQMYKDKGFVLVGIPSNDFGKQTPEGPESLRKFCRGTWGLKFPIMKKSVVSGDKKIDLYKQLIEATDKKEVAWNFEKFLVNKQGKVIRRFPSYAEPMSNTIRKRVKWLLDDEYEEKNLQLVEDDKIVSP